MTSIQWIPPGGDISEAWKIREAVFIKEQHVSYEEEADGLDPVSWHIVIFEDEVPFATGRLYDLGGGTYKFGRIAVKKEKRGHNLGRFLLSQMLDKARDLGAGRVELGAQVQAQGFYEKAGFSPYGTLYMDAGIRHIHMRLVL